MLPMIFEMGMYRILSPFVCVSGVQIIPLIHLKDLQRAVHV